MLPDPAALVFDTTDPSAAELAHRLAALAEHPARAIGVPTAAVPFTIQWRMAGACLLPLDLPFPTPCLQLASLLGKASWLQRAALTGLPVETGEDLGLESLVAAERVARRNATAPLADPARRLEQLGLVHPVALTHPWLIARGDLGGVTLDFDGTPLLAGLGRAVREPLP